MNKCSRFFVLLVLALALCICNGCKPEAPPPGGKIRLSFGYFAEREIVPVVEEIVSRFRAENPDIEVETQTAPYAAFYEKLRIQLPAGDAPDLWISDGALVFEFAAHGAIRDVTDWARRDLNFDDYYCMDAVTDHTGKVWAIPQSFQSFALMYNKGLFDEANVPYPMDDWTWQDALEAAKALTKDRNGDGRIDQFGIDGHGFPQILVRASGGRVIDPATRKSLVASPETIRGYQFFVDMYRKYRVTPTPEASTTYGGPLELFARGDLAMFVGLYYWVKLLEKRSPALEVELALPPKIVSRGVYFVPNCFVITKSSPIERQEAAWKFILFFSRHENQKLYGEEGEGLPFLKKAAADLIEEHSGRPKRLDVFLQVMRDSVWIEVNPVFNECQNRWLNEMARAAMGEESVEEASRRADTQVQDILDRMDVNLY